MYWEGFCVRVISHSLLKISNHSTLSYATKGGRPDDQYIPKVNTCAVQDAIESEISLAELDSGEYRPLKVEISSMTSLVVYRKNSLQMIWLLLLAGKSVSKSLMPLKHKDHIYLENLDERQN